MAISRRANNNTYCQSTKRIFLENPAFSRAATVIDLVHAQCGRYYKLNLQSYTRHHTIEFRQHQGTVSAEKISSWVRFLNGFIDESRRIANGIETAPAAANLPNLPNLNGAQARLAGLLAGDGQSADFLQGALNLLPHSLRAAISYLRKAGVAIESSRRNGQTMYRLAAAAATAATRVADTLFAGIDADLQRFYRRRAAAFAA
ncbi:MAG: amidoligase family protein [Bilophila sp.]